MPETAPKAELMRSLARLVRGLSALFWGLPIALLICVKTATNEWLKPFGMLPPLLSTGLLFYGLLQLGHFQKQERIWHLALDRAKLLGLVNIGLSPFLYFWNMQPANVYFGQAVGVLAVSSLVFLFNLNHVLQRLTAMLPDETLRLETRFFTTVNFYLLAIMVALLVFHFGVQNIDDPPDWLALARDVLEMGRQWMVLGLLLLPVAMTMTLLWKIKEVILESVFTPESGNGVRE